MSAIYVHKKNGIPIGFVADIGKDLNGKRIKTFFKNRLDAEKFIASHQKDPTPVGVLFDHRNEFLYCFEKLQSVGATLNEATEFFLKHGASKPNVTIERAINEFATEKERVGRRDVYLNSIPVMYGGFSTIVGKETLVRRRSQMRHPLRPPELRNSRIYRRRSWPWCSSIWIPFCRSMRRNLPMRPGQRLI